MTSSLSWWEPALQTWCAGLGCEYTVFPADEARAVGTYWRSQESLFIQLDPYHVVRVENIDWKEEMCQALAWTLMTFYQSARRTWQEIAVERIVEYANLQDHAFGDAWGNALRAVPDPSFHPARAGYFAWIHFGEPTTPHSMSGEHQNTVEEITKAMLPRSVVGWPMPGSDGRTLLLFCQPPDDLEAWLADDDLKTGGAVPSRVASEQAWLRDTLNELVNMLAAEALILSRVAVGARVPESAGFHAGLVTAVACWRTRWFTTQNERVYIWGEHPWVALFHAIGDDSVRPFLSVAEQRAPEGHLRLNPELTETLQGVIKANLNVSEAARILYLHRNTLMNRIERIRQQTGYDIRSFEDAFVLWMVQILQTGDKS